MSAKKQIPYLHYLRAVAILMVVALHSITPYISDAAIYGKKSWYVYLFINAVTRGGVPMFLMLSGYLMLNDDASRDFSVFYRKRLSRILIPLCIWNVIYYVFYCVFNGAPFKLTELAAQSLDCGTAYHFWYVYTLFGIYLVTPFLKRLADTCSLKQLVWLEVLICLCTTLRPFVDTVLPVYIFMFEPLFNGYIGFFLLGYILGKTDIKSRAIPLFALMGLVGTAMSAVGNHISSSAQGIDLSFNSGYNISYFLIAASFFMIFKSINLKQGRVFAAVRSLSSASFGIYLVHVGVMDIITRYFMIDASPLVSSLYLFVLTVPISAALSLVIGKVKYLT